MKLIENNISNPSPTGDEWFNNPENIAEVEAGIEEAKQGKVKAYTIDEIKDALLKGHYDN
jgi:hypothetical protein